MKLFVYGTLKRDYGNNSLIKEINGEYLGTFLTKEKYCMSTVGFPFVFRDNRESEYKGYIKGEVYRIAKGRIDIIDNLEGHPNWYTREIIKLNNGDKAWIYIISEFNLDYYRGKLIKPINEIIEFTKEV